MTPYQVNVAAESFVATLFSQAGFDVALQYGTTQPDWDLIATHGPSTLKLQVKGSQDGGWGLFQSYIKNADYHGALSLWLENQAIGIIYVLVQFKGVTVGQVPRCYIATPQQIVDHMRTTRSGHAYTSLREEYTWSRGIGAGHTDRIPESWRITPELISSPSWA
jgi:hypothetical protein